MSLSSHGVKILQLTPKSSEIVLQKVLKNETVQPIATGSVSTDVLQLKQRLVGNKRIFALFSPNHPSTPLNILCTAFLSRFPDQMQTILPDITPTELHQEIDPERITGLDGSPTTAVFYSINKVKDSEIEADAHLAKQRFAATFFKEVVEMIQRDVPTVNTFSTFSPVPQLRSFIADTSNEGFFKVTEAEKRECGIKSLSEIASFDKERLQDPKVANLLLKMCARYLSQESAKTPEEKKKRCPVAKFHLGNGARLNKVYWMADTSDIRMNQSLGIMVSYQYISPEFHFEREYHPAVHHPDVHIKSSQKLIEQLTNGTHVLSAL